MEGLGRILFPRHGSLYNMGYEVIWNERRPRWIVIEGALQNEIAGPQCQENKAAICTRSMIEFYIKRMGWDGLLNALRQVGTVGSNFTKWLYMVSSKELRQGAVGIAIQLFSPKSVGTWQTVWPPATWVGESRPHLPWGQPGLQGRSRTWEPHRNHGV